MTAIPLPTSRPQPQLAPAGASPLSPDQLIEYQSALQRGKKVRRAITVAATDAWLTAIFAGLTLLCSIFSLTGLILGIALAFIAFNSFRGLRGLKRFDLSAPKLLALNQLTLIAILTLYALYSIWAGRNGDPELARAVAGNAAVEGSLGNLNQLLWYITLAVYGTLIFATLVAQGGAALYYITRRKHLEAYLSQTPPWIIALQKAGA
ncbi:MAG TPA: hypothetical protein VM008_08185 [Phycisphaerae bacterium]|nr:hypothetical protein [Phycisphaerae bacterium]